MAWVILGACAELPQLPKVILKNKFVIFTEIIIFNFMLLLLEREKFKKIIRFKMNNAKILFLKYPSLLCYDSSPPPGGITQY